MIYNIDENIPLSVIVLKNNGTPQDGETVEVFIYDDDTPVLVIDAALMIEDLVGYYRYNFVHGKTVNTNYTWYAVDAGKFVGGGKFRVTTNKQEIINNIDSNEGTIA